ncbi:BglG family transcription antiterminator [Paenibacillus donghaensis]|uniref:BglG family transcription antiterminator n=1 Tax=Paenibacillus donghaensis TaxID=414771 RepID=UPI001883287E|nr:BglG family transcription antiterminator [Paenibacillus donghaensis]MBE9917412.1 BglG family transcription antiterminator [Paenibacillus donghaensis]
MNARQKRLLTFFLTKEPEFISIKELASKMDCSEKTIRNDFKVLDNWILKRSQAVLIRKPSAGVCLHAEDFEKKHLLQELDHVQVDMMQDHRKLCIAKLLLIRDEWVTIQELAEHFFTNRAVIREDLDELDEWAERYRLVLIRRQNYGVKLEGPERMKRCAISTIAEIAPAAHKSSFEMIADWFAPSEKQMAECRLRRLESTLTFNFTDLAFQSLLFHVLIAYHRFKSGFTLNELPRDSEIIRQKPEYEQMKALVRDLDTAFAVSLPEEEILNLTLHLLGAKIHLDPALKPNEREDILKQLEPGIVTFTEDLIRRVSQKVGPSIVQDEDLRVLLAIHLDTAVARYRHGLIIVNPMLREIKKMYFYILEILYSVLPDLEKEYGIHLPEDEVGYVAVHFQSSLERNRQQQTATALIVCTMGIGISQLLRTKIKRSFDSVDIVATSSVTELNKSIRLYKPDFLISVVPLDEIDLPVCMISPLFTDADQQKLQHFIESRQNSKPVAHRFPVLRSMLDKSMIKIHTEKVHEKFLLVEMAEQLREEGYVEEGYTESMLKREAMSSTSIGGGILLPHGKNTLVRRSRVLLHKLKCPLIIENESIYFVFMLALRAEDLESQEQLFYELGEIVDDPVFLERLKAQHTPADLYDCF